MPEVIVGRCGERAFQVAGLEDAEQAGMHEALLGDCKESERSLVR